MSLPARWLIRKRRHSFPRSVCSHSLGREISIYERNSLHQTKKQSKIESLTCASTKTRPKYRKSKHRSWEFGNHKNELSSIKYTHSSHSLCQWVVIKSFIRLYINCWCQVDATIGKTEGHLHSSYCTLLCTFVSNFFP